MSGSGGSVPSVRFASQNQAANTAAAALRAVASSVASARPEPVSRYRWRGGRSAGASVSQVVSSRSRSASRTRIGYGEPGMRSSCWHSW
jgi:hypothetical protein